MQLNINLEDSVVEKLKEANSEHDLEKALTHAVTLYIIMADMHKKGFEIMAVKDKTTFTGF